MFYKKTIKNCLIIYLYNIKKYKYNLEKGLNITKK